MITPCDACKHDEKIHYLQSDKGFHCSECGCVFYSCILSEVTNEA